MDQKAYLKRIGLENIPLPNLQTLSELQKAHLFAVPFENLDIHIPRLIRLDIDSIYRKVVINRRGGFCYELNGLFFELLRSIGFQAKRISARVFDSKKGFGPDFDHMAIVVRLDESDYLSDVGFGEFTFGPLKIQMNSQQKDSRGVFRIEPHPQADYCVSQLDGDWRPVYLFSVKPRALEEYDAMCTFHQTSPQSHFTQKRLCSLPVENGRITLSGNRLSFPDGKEILVTTDQEFKHQLATHFGIQL